MFVIAYLLDILEEAREFYKSLVREISDYETSVLNKQIDIATESIAQKLSKKYPFYTHGTIKRDAELAMFIYTQAYHEGALSALSDILKDTK